MAEQNQPQSRAGWSASVSVRLTPGAPTQPAASAAAITEWLNQAVSLHQQNRLPEAEQLYRQVLTAAPNHHHANHLLGLLAHQVGHHAAAVEHISKAIAADGRFPRFHHDLAGPLKALGRFGEAEASLRRYLKFKPDEAGAYNNLGTILQDMIRQDEAEAAYRRALELKPDFAEAWSNFGSLMQDQDRSNEALQAAQRAAALKPDFASAQANLGLIFHALGRLDEALPAYARALELQPDNAVAASNRLLCMLYSDGVSEQTLLDEHRAWDARHGVLGRRDAVSPANDRDPERRLRIGYVSADLRTHPIGYFMIDVLAKHDRSQVEVFCYSHTPSPDETTARLRGAADHWRELLGVADDAAAAMVREDRIDILIDLSGHTANNRLTLFTHRPAPVQASWLGYPGTTGLAGIDYLLMDAAAVPPGAEQWCSEAVVRLPHSRFCYAPPAYAPDVADPAARGDRPVTFGSFNNVTKLGPSVLRLWAEVLKAAPGSRLVLKWKSLTEPATRQRLLNAFAEAGVASDRIEVRDRSPHVDMLAEYADVDVALDPFPFCGGLTSCEALWMGVPVVTLPGERPASRQTLGFLDVLGLNDLAAASPADYVRIAADLAADPERRARLRRSLRPWMAASPLCDGARFTQGLEAAFRQMWRRWCAGEPAAPLDVAPQDERHGRPQ